MICQSANIPDGRPDILFYVPSVVGFTYVGEKVDSEKIAIAQDLLGTEHCPVYRNRDLNDFFICCCEIHNLNIPQDAESALELYTSSLVISKRTCLRFKYRTLPSSMLQV